VVPAVPLGDVNWNLNCYNHSAYTPPSSEHLLSHCYSAHNPPGEPTSQMHDSALHQV